MSRFMQAMRLAVIAAATFALSVGLGADRASAKKKEPVELDEAAVYIEWNSTDTDYGIQFFWDSVGFTKMTVSAGKKKVLDVKTAKNVRAQGLTEGFFESVEPPASELSMEQFFARFPEGRYDFRGKGIEKGVRLVGEAEFTHVLPAPPDNLSPAEDDVVSVDGFLASFDPVTMDTDGNPIDIELYVVVVEKEDDDPILQTFEVVLPPTRTEIFVPAEFLEPDTEYKLEVIAQEESGNRTITEEGSFVTDGDE